MKTAKIPPNFHFVIHGHVQHASGEWHKEHCIWYHCNIVPESHELQDVVALASEDSTALGQKTFAVSSQRSLDQQEA